MFRPLVTDGFLPSKIARSFRRRSLPPRDSKYAIAHPFVATAAQTFSLPKLPTLHGGREGSSNGTWPAVKSNKPEIEIFEQYRSSSAPIRQPAMCLTQAKSNLNHCVSASNAISFAKRISPR